MLIVMKEYFASLSTEHPAVLQLLTLHENHNASAGSVP
jgi:hypothetical protein